MTVAHIHRRIPGEMPAVGRTGATADPWGAAREVGTHVVPSAPRAGSGHPLAAPTPARRLGPAALALATAGAALMALWRLQTASPLWTVAWLAVAAVALFALVATWEPVRDAELEADDLDW